MSLKVLHIIKSLDRGGIENLALDFCNNAHRHGIEMHLICIGGGELEAEFAMGPARFHKFSKLSFPYDVVDPRLVKRLRSYIRENKIEVVHSHFADEALHAYFATRGMKKVVKLLSCAVDFRVNRKIDNLKFKLLAPKMDVNVALSQALLNQMRTYGLDKKGNGHVVHNGIDPERILQEAPSTLREELQLPEETVLAGMVGNFYNAVRDQFTICQALPAVVKKRPDFHFVFAGGWQNQWVKKNLGYYQQCYNFCRKHNLLKNVHFLGLRRDVSNVFKSLDFYVHSTNFDTFGLAPVEAAFNHLPVLANDVEVFREVSGAGSGMRLYQSKNPAELAEKMMQLAEQPQLRAKLGEQHFEHAEKHYHIDVHIENMKALYLKKLAEK